MWLANCSSCLGFGAALGLGVVSWIGLGRCLGERVCSLFGVDVGIVCTTLKWGHMVSQLQKVGIAQAARHKLASVCNAPSYSSLARVLDENRALAYRSRHMQPMHGVLGSL